MNEILIESRGLCKNFAALPALQNVTFTLPKGRIVGLLGPNGRHPDHRRTSDWRGNKKNRFVFAGPQLSIAVDDGGTDVRVFCRFLRGF